MDIREILQEENIQLDADAGTKEEVLKTMAEMLFRSGKIEDADTFLNDVCERERMGFTGAGSKMAIPHGISQKVKKVSVAIVRTRGDIYWGTEQEDIPEEAKRVQFIVLFAVPAKPPKTGEIKYIEALKAVCRKLADRRAAENLLQARRASQIIEIINDDKQ
ncbi:MAG: PTS sugar transporter subunit IIA [Clostridiales bacterium]|nr:PTS sugar transporter subunit IIA [Clostridiales bacterium]